MFSGRPNTTSDSSSGDEIDQPEKQQTDHHDNTGVGRSYECSFCKRGFTNAQALGGHMNIHRKDKAKAKKKDHDHDHHHQDIISPKSHDQKFNFPAISSHEQRIYSSSLGAYMRCQLYFPGPNPNQLHVNCDRFGLGMGSGMMRKDHRTLHEYHRMDQSLSLRIGSNSHLDDHVGAADHVDLELRLGHP